MFNNFFNFLSSYNKPEVFKPKEVSTIYHSINDMHIAVITSFVPKINVSIYLAKPADDEWHDKVIFRVYDVHNKPVDLSSKRFVDSKNGKTISFYIYNCIHSEPYRVEILSRIEDIDFGQKKFIIVYASA